ncbi:flagellar motor switch protein FliG [Gammaproteobacteria bacterium]
MTESTDIALAPTSKALSGVERAAILLLALGEDDAAVVMRGLGPKEVQKVGIAMASVPHVSRETVQSVLSDFVNSAQDQTALGVNSDSYIRNVIVKAVGEEKAKNILDLILLGASTKGLDTLKWMEPRAVADVIRLEHPQIIAIVLAYLEPDQAAEVLSILPERVRPDILLRIATLEGINPIALQELNDIMERQFSGKTAVKSSGLGGIKTTASILNFLDSTMESQIMENIHEVDSEMASRIQDLMFVFENLLDVEDRGIQALLREVPSETLLLAIKGSDEAMKEKFFKNMSKRAAEMLKDDLDSKGPVKISEVEVAQKEILSIARRMADAGEISLSGGSEQYV